MVAVQLLQSPIVNSMADHYQVGHALHGDPPSYNASEGLLRRQDDPSDSSSRSVLDYGILLRFLPMDGVLETTSSNIVPLSGVETGLQSMPC